MAGYTYKIRAEDGKVVKGTVEATTLADAAAKVKKLGGLTLDIQPVRGSAQPTSQRVSRRGVALKDRIIFTEQLAVMLNAGVNLVQALKGLEEEGSNGVLRSVLRQVIADVEGGMTFSSALSKHPQIFSTIYCQMVKASEKSGNLSDALNKLTVQQQKEYDLKGKVRGALIYPAIVSVLLVAVIIIVITFILPKLSGMFTESGAKLPASTLFLLGLSNFMTHDWYILVGILVVGGVLVRFALSKPQGRLVWDRVKIRIPVLGSFTKKAYMARFAESFSSLAKAGVPVLDVFETLKGVIGNSVYEAEIDKIAKDVENGIKVSTAIRKSPYFPPMIGQLVSVGEQSGDLAGIFEVLGQFFEKEVDGMAKNLSTILEPVIMIVMGIGIGFVLIAVLQPIYGLVNAV